MATRPISALLSLAALAVPASAGWGYTSDMMEYFSTSTRRDYLYNSKKIHIEYVGCAVGYSRIGGDEDGDGECLENSSEDGLYSWFQMSNCMRAQVVYNVYAGGSGCSEGSFQESIITRDGLAEFAYMMSTYDSSSPISYDMVNDLPDCEYDGDNGYYLGVGCSSSGGFTIERFTDNYCLSHYDTLYNLDDINSALKKLKSCHTCYDSSSGESAYNSLCGNIVPSGSTCTTADSPLCTNFSGFSTTGVARRAFSSSSTASWANKFKYVLGSILLAASVMMFLGILFTNRRRRRAMMHRKFRQAAARKKSRSKSRSGNRSRSRSGRDRSKSKSRSHSRSNMNADGTPGVLT